MKLISHLNVLRLCGRPNRLLGKKRTMNTTTSDVLGLPEVLQFLTSFAPLSLAESWDNVGLIIEPISPVPIKKILLTIDLTETVMREAVDYRADMIIAYHPPIFQPLKRITNGKWKERLIATCLEKKIAVYSPHTTWDSVKGGLSDWLASPFDFDDVEPLQPSSGELIKKAFSHHVTVFCPSVFSDKCHQILIGNRAEILSSSQLESMVKYMVIAKRRFLPEIERGLNESQCYYSIYERGPVSPEGCGTGRFGQLKTPLKLSDAVRKIKNLVGMSQIRLALEDGKTLDSTVNSVALVAGSGASLLRGVRADLYVTGEMLHHDILEANHSGASVILINHSDSERGFLHYFAPLLADHFGAKLNVTVSKADKDPINIV